MSRRSLIVVVGLLLSGCMVVQVGVTNPVPGLTRVAVVPFFNQSHERAVDGRRFAFAYFSELQKTPGFEVVPVGVTEQVIADNQLEMGNPADALRLAELLGVDAVVIGSVTDYDPYYPPRIGMHVAWYSPYQWTFFPGVQTDPYARRRLEHFEKQNKQPPSDHVVGETQGFNRLRKFGRVTGLSRLTALRHKLDDDEAMPFAGESSTWQPPQAGSSRVAPKPSTDAITSPDEITAPNETPDATEPETGNDDESVYLPADWLGNVRGQSPDETTDYEVALRSRPQIEANSAEWADAAQPAGIGCPPQAAGIGGPTVHNPLEPLMSYTRIYDGTDADVVALLRDYVELNGDLRSGGWEAYLHRSEDFVRFTAHRMIVEMLTLHGGEARRRVVFKHRKHK